MSSRKTSEELRAEVARLRDKLALQEEQVSAVKDFLASMSHSLRTSMHGISGMAHLLMDTSLDAEQRDFTETILSTTDGLRSTVSDIIDLSRMEQGRLKLDNLEFDLRRLVRGVDRMILLAATEKGIAYLSRVDSEVPARFRGDPGRLRQVLLNLLNNAVNYTASGEVRFDVGYAEDCDDGPGLTFSVSDTGPGISMSKEALFRAFARPVAGSNGSGIGLGIPMSAKLVELMGGKLDLDSAHGRGTRVSFSLPLEPTAIKFAESAIEEAGLKDQRVLVVVPDRMERYVIKSITKLWGCEPDGAAGAIEAMAMAARAASLGRPYDVGIVDHFVTGMEPEELGHGLRKIPGSKDTVFVLIADPRRRMSAHALRKAGYLAYLAKPVTSLQLFECLKLANRATSAGNTSVRGGKVLLVEDNETNRIVAERLLQKAGFVVDKAADGEEGIAALEKTRYDLVLMDVQMPGMGGIEAVKRIRDPLSKVVDRRVPVIAMTAQALDGDREQCMAAGMNDYISKPIQPEDLFALMERWISAETTADDSDSVETAG